MNYQLFFQDLLRKADSRDFDRKAGLKFLATELLCKQTKNLEILYDCDLLPELKKFLLSSQKKILETPWIFHIYLSLVKELRTMFLKWEYLEIEKFLNEEFHLILDENSEKMGLLCFEQFSENFFRKEEILVFFRVFKEGKVVEMKNFLKELGYVNRIEEDDYRAFYKTNDDCFENYVDELFHHFFMNYKKFNDSDKKDSYPIICQTLRLHKLIRERTKDKFLNNQKKYERENDKMARRIVEGGNILMEQYEKSNIEISKQSKEENEKNFISLLEILKGFDFEKFGIKEPLFIFFGSFRSGFALNGSDIDTTILTNSAFGNY